MSLASNTSFQAGLVDRLRALKSPSLGNTITVKILALRTCQWLALFLPIAISYAVWTPFSLQAGLDPSWISFLVEATRANLQFGTDIVFTFGPYGYAYAPTAPLALLPAWWLVRITLCMVLTTALFGLVREGKWSFWTALLGAFAVAVGYEFGFAFCALLIVYRLADPTSSPRLGKILLVIGLALVGLIKFSFFVVGLAVLLILDFETVVRHRKLPWMIVTWMVSTLFFWVLAGQNVLNFPTYLATSLEVASGYSEAMYWWQPQHRTVQVYLSHVGLTALLLTSVYLILKSEGWWRFVPMLAMTVLSFILFKSGFVRHDVHEVMARAGILSLCLLCVAALWSQSTARAPRLVLAGSLLFCLLHLYVDNGGVYHHLKLVRNHARDFPQYAFAFWNGSNLLNEMEQESRAKIIAQFPLPPLSGTVDAYTWGLAIPLAHQLPIRNRPVIQSYSAYTPRLAERNAAHLRSNSAADHLLMEMMAIDGQLLALQDSLSWPEFLSRYQSRGQFGELLILDRLQTPQPYRLVPLQTAEIEVGEFYSVNSKPNELLWLELDLKSTLFRKAALIANKDAETTFHIDAGGTVQPFRILPALASAGFLLNPLVRNTAEFQKLMAEHAGLAVDRIKVAAHSRYIQPQVGLKLYRLELGHTSP